MKNVLIEKYLEHLHKAYEAERAGDKEARQYHISMAEIVFRFAAKEERLNKENQNDSL